MIPIFLLLLWVSRISAVTEEHTVNIKLNDNVPKQTTVGKIWKSLNPPIPKDVHHIIIGSTTFSKFHDFFKISQKGEVITIKYIDRDNREEICGPLNCCAKNICDFQTNVILTYLSSKSTINFQINFEIFDENDNSPKFSQLKFNINVLEEQKHYRMSLPTAYDLDSSINGVFNYSLSENYKKFFQLSTQNGYPELLVLSSFDYENIAERKFHLQLTAFDRGGRFETMNLFIITIDINDNKPIFEKEIYKLVVKENTTYANPLLVLKATDKDGGENGKINYRIDSLTSPDMMDKFLLNKSNGEIKLIQKLDYEIYSDQLIELTIEAVDEGTPQFTGVCKLEVRSSDINDNAPRIEILKNISIAENKRVFTPVMSLYIHDDDSIQNKVQCTKKNNENFRLHSTQENSLIIYTESIFDFENASLVRLDIQCMDSGVPPMVTDKTLYISILDENDNFPIFEHDRHKYQVSEDTKIGEFLFQSSARDLDSGNFGKITYRLDNIGGRDFSINSSTGQIHLTNSLDRELKDIIEFTIYAVDGGGLESSVRVSITVMDVNDNPPKLKSPKILNVMENERIGALIGKIEVWDPDEGENSRVTLENEADENALFYSYLRLEDNKIYIKSSIDREKVSQIFLRLKLIDHGRPKLTSWDTITISIIDENDNDPILIYPSEGDMINSRSPVFVNTPFHSLVLTMQAKDLDFDENGKIKFRIKDECNGSRYFHVNETSGDIYSTWSCRSGQYLSCPMPGLYRLNIELKDGSSSTSRMTKSHFFITIHEYSETNGLVEFNSNSFFKNVIILVMIVVFSIVLAVGLVGAIVWARTRQSVQFNVCSNTPSNTVKKNLKPNHWFYDPQLLLPDTEVESQFLNVEKSNFTSGTPPNEIILHKIYSNNLDEYDRSAEVQAFGNSRYTPLDPGSSSAIQSQFPARSCVDNHLNKSYFDNGRSFGPHQPPLHEINDDYRSKILDRKSPLMQDIPDFLKDSKYSKESWYSDYYFNRDSGHGTTDENNYLTCFP